MKYLICQLLALFLTTKSLFSQEQIFSGDVGLTYFFDAVADEHGNYYLVCLGSDDSVHLIKYDESQTPIWAKRYAYTSGNAALAILNDQLYLFQNLIGESSLTCYLSDGNIRFVKFFSSDVNQLSVNKNRLILWFDDNNSWSGGSAELYIVDASGMILNQYFTDDNYTSVDFIAIDPLDNIVFSLSKYVEEEDGSGHVNIVLRQTNLIKISPTGDILWEVEDLNGDERISYIAFDEYQNNYVYFENDKLIVDEYGNIIKQGKLSEISFSSVIYNFDECSGLQLAALEGDRLYDCKFKRDDLYELEFVYSYPTKEEYTSYSLTSRKTSKTGYISYLYGGYKYGGTKTYYLYCFDVLGNLLIDEKLLTSTIEDQLSSRDHISFPDGKILFFYVMYDNSSNKSTYKTYVMQPDAIYPVIDLTTDCPEFDECNDLDLIYDPQQKTVNARMSSAGYGIANVFYSIYDVTGKQIMKINGYNQINEDVRRLSKGMYFMTATFDHINFCTKQFTIY